MINDDEYPSSKAPFIENKNLTDFLLINVYAETLIKIANGARMDDAIDGLPSPDELKAEFKEMIKGKLNYVFDLPGLGGQTIHYSKLMGVLKNYEVKVCLDGETLGTLTKDNLECDLSFSTEIKYDPYTDMVVVEYKHPQGSLQKAYWNSDKKEFMNSMPGCIDRKGGLR